MDPLDLQVLFFLFIVLYFAITYLLLDFAYSLNHVKILNKFYK